MKPLRILIGNNTLSLLAGSETWVLTLAIQLKKMGHHVACFSPELGIIAKNLKDAGIQSYDQISVSGIKPASFILEEKIDHTYDVIICNHHHIVAALRAEFPKTPIISTIHGIIHFMDDGRGNQIMAPEHPALESGVNQFVSVSEEIQEKLKVDYNLDSTIVRNFFDIKKYKAKRPISKTPQAILINSNYNDAKDPEVEVIRAVAKHYGARLIAIGQNFTPSLDTMRAIEDADIVFGLGRSVLEGVCAGRLGIVHGRWGTGGVICEKNIEDIRRFNFSGRNKNGEWMTAEQLIDEINKYYNQDTIDWGKDYIVKNHNAAFAAESYVAMARELLGQNISAPAEVRRIPYRRQKDA